ncbi:telomere repeats-binding bouquet formation protein 1 [Chiloscyllium plagiosum]|uniref:telomere repeats-binding bouquet formation protein 1 n=1 Tax=Chiloscyllium plagiosum TaxID=36176 RepID=UPI001CB81D4F|nr:telomere repeats-binding bouquet formation protein 1 [Chiloscyllium plagiosum]
MENPGRTDGKILCGQKTDLNLLLECLKYQMDSPVTQKQALITIHSICQQNSEASDYFREIGGLQFVNGLIKLSDASILREAALFTLAALAESSVYCQQSLCTAELLSGVALSLAQEDASLILKRMNVYMILVLVSHNKIGQTLARTTGCIDVLLNLFRTNFPMSDKQSIDENIGRSFELWSSISSTLCACVNNPQNEENQRLCAAAFPFAKDCLQKCIRQEVIRPICAFIGLAVANNSYVQDYFCSVGGLDAVAQILVRLVDESIRHHSSRELAISVVKTLNSCISENPPVVSRLSEYFIVPKLVALLLQNDLDINSKLGIILAIGHCTDGCEAHQYQLLQSNGLPLMIQIVAESQDEEQRKAATFVLQSCQLITEKLSKSLMENVQPSGDTVTTYGIDYPKNNSLKDYWKFAEGFLSRIKTLEKQQEESCEPLLKGIDKMLKQREDMLLKHSNEQLSLDNTKMDNWTGETRQAKNQDITPEKRKFDLTHRKNERREEDSVIPAINPTSSRNKENKRQYRDQQLMEKVKRQIFVEDDVSHEIHRVNRNADQFGNSDKLSSDAEARNMNSQQHDLPIGRTCSGGQSISPDTQNRNRVPEMGQQHGEKSWSVQCGKPSNQSITVPEAKLLRQSTSREEQKTQDKLDFKKRVIDDTFKRPAPNRRKRSKQTCKDSLNLCSDLINIEITSTLTSPAPSLTAGQDFRCSGCSTVAASLNSRNFCKILQLCPNKCDRHKVIQECEDRYKKELKKLLTCYSSMTDKKNLLTPIKKAASHMTNFHTQHSDFLIKPKPSVNNFHTKKILLTPIQKTASHMTNYCRQQTNFITWPKPSTKDVNVTRFLLTPMKKSTSGVPAVCLQRDNTQQFRPSMGQDQKYRLDCRQALHDPQLCNQITLQDHAYTFDDNEHSDNCEYILRRRKKKKRRKRKNFTEEEVGYLLDGVRKMGYHWNSILWSYPFQKGRTNVDLSRKYRSLQKGNSPRKV